MAIDLNIVEQGKVIGRKSCKNCNSETLGAYCHQCGQNSDIGRITFTETLSQFLVLPLHFRVL